MLHEIQTCSDQQAVDHRAAHKKTRTDHRGAGSPISPRQEIQHEFQWLPLPASKKISLLNLVLTNLITSFGAWVLGWTRLIKHGFHGYFFLHQAPSPHHPNQKQQSRQRPRMLLWSGPTGPKTNVALHLLSEQCSTLVVLIQSFLCFSTRNT